MCIYTYIYIERERDRDVGRYRYRDVGSSPRALAKGCESSRRYTERRSCWDADASSRRYDSWRCGTLFAKAEQFKDSQSRKKRGKVSHSRRYFLVGKELLHAYWALASRIRLLILLYTIRTNTNSTNTCSINTYWSPILYYTLIDTILELTTPLACLAWPPLAERKIKIHKRNNIDKKSSRKETGRRREAAHEKRFKQE